MGMCLYNNREEISLSFRFVPWARILDLAQYYGWQPMGTVDPCWDDDPDSEFYVDQTWDGNYGTNALQTVTAEDANALADALERALADVPDDEINSELLLGPEGGKQLKELIAFCRKGEFLLA